MKKQIYTIIIFLITALAVSAQKLPPVQKESLAIPKSLKIDAKANEWENKFQAYNRPTGISYLMANNEDNLYLIIQAKDPIICKKIICGGITLTLNLSGKRNDNKSITFQYPLLETKESSEINVMFNAMLSIKDAPKSVDSSLNIMNKQMTRVENKIKVSGIKSIDDSIISIYNKQRIKALALFDNTGALTYELLIPLKYIETPSDTQERKIAYNIMLNGTAANNKTVIHEKGNGEVVTVSAIAKGSLGPSKSEADFMTLTYPTDFWAFYTFIKQ